MERALIFNAKKTKTINKSTLLTVLSAITFLGMAAYGALKLTDAGYAGAQATLILLQGVVGFILSWFPFIVKKLFRLRVSFAVQLMITAFMFLSMFLGEAFEFYYRLPWWDSMLHTASGFGIAFLAYCLIFSVIKDSNLKNKTAFCIIGAIAVSFAVGLVWEIAEFSIDSIFGTNMQKIIPDAFFNGGQTNETLAGTQEEIAEFFASPAGYRYALMDTMKDIICCLAGTVLFVLLAAATKKSSVYGTAVTRLPRVQKRATRTTKRARESVFTQVAAKTESIGVEATEQAA